MAKITKIVLHHFGGLGTDQRASTQRLTERHIESAHSARFAPFRSELSGSEIGYTVVCWPGGWKQYRYVGEQTAGAKGHNFDAVHISLAGNFVNGVDVPTKRQLEDQAELVKALVDGEPERIGLKVLPGTEISVSALDVGPHRLYAPKGYTQCNGDYFDDDFGRRVALEHLAKKYGSVPWVSLYIRKMLESLKPRPRQLAGNDRDDEGIL